MRKKFVFCGLALGALVLVGAGCESPFNVAGTNKAGRVEGGVYKTVDKGENWKAFSQFWTLGAPKAFNEASIVDLALDPQDHNAVYAASAESGIFYTYSGANGWFQPEQIKAGSVQSVAVDPRNKCLIYAVIGNTVVRSEDCNREYKAIYQETRPRVNVNNIVVDPANSNILYLGNSAGDVNRSTDRGRSWAAVKRFENSIGKIIINPLSPNILYVATAEKGVFRSPNAGLDWQDLNEPLKKYGGAFVFHDLALMDARSETLLLASQYGLIKSGDAGVSWTALDLLTPPNGADIKVLAVGPVNPNEIFYATQSTFYKSSDGGKQWVTKKLPSSREPASLIIDTKDPKVFYLGFAPIKK